MVAAVPAWLAAIAIALLITFTVAILLVPGFQISTTDLPRPGSQPHRHPCPRTPVRRANRPKAQAPIRCRNIRSSTILDSGASVFTNRLAGGQGVPGQDDQRGSEDQTSGNGGDVAGGAGLGHVGQDPGHQGGGFQPGQEPEPSPPVPDATECWRQQQEANREKEESSPLKIGAQAVDGVKSDGRGGPSQGHG